MKKFFLVILGCIVAQGPLNAYDPPFGAVTGGYPPFVQQELDDGADVNKIFSNGNTVLHIAVQYDPTEAYLEIVRMLLNAGADVSLQNDDGRTPLEEAYFFNNQQAAQLIEDHIARIERKKSAREEIEALLGARGQRTGAQSPAQVLTEDDCRHIYELLKKD